MKRLVIVYLGVLVAAILASGCGKVSTAIPATGNSLPAAIGSSSSSSSASASGSIKTQLTCIATNGLTGVNQTQYNYQATTYSNGDQEIVCNQDNYGEHIELIASSNVSANNGKCILGNSYRISATYGNVFTLSSAGQVSLHFNDSVSGTVQMTCATESF